MNESNSMKGRISLIFRKSMSSRVGVVTKEKLDITTKTKIKYSNKMESKIELKRLGEKDLNSSIGVINKHNYDKTCRIFINPHSRMCGKIDLKIPPVIIDEFNPIKDTHIDESNPIFNYGKFLYLKVGTDDNGYRSRTYIDFDLSSLKDNINIFEAKLYLYSDDINSFEGLELSSCKREYYEAEPTWMRKMPKGEVVGIKNIQGLECVFDVTEFIIKNWYQKEYNNHGFILKGFDESIKQIKYFGSRDSFRKPRLVIKYRDLGLYLPGFGGLKSSLRVAAGKGMNTDVEVYRRVQWSPDLDGDVFVRRSDSPVFNVKINNPNLITSVDINGCAGMETKVQVYYSGYDSKMSRVKVNNNVMISRVRTVGARAMAARVSITDFKGLKFNIKVNHNCISGKVSIRDWCDMKSSVDVFRLKSWPTTVRVNKNLILSHVNVAQYKDIVATVEVQNDWNSLKSNILILNAKMNSKINISQKEDMLSRVGKIIGCTGVKSEIRIYLKMNEDRTSKIEVTPCVEIPASVKIENNDIMVSRVSLWAKKNLPSWVKTATMKGMDTKVNVIAQSGIRTSVLTLEKGRYKDVYVSVEILNKRKTNKNYVFIL